ncbi:uroporphyrinogen-III synthase [Azospirillum fermentarium]|uniref:uroporphyrinogen-III synthase n=1 Tax=Azospirillum fermentarium TaxID=1233114 RepID=UPI0022275C4F|nr:uroporphyrinogen-III synthase [Azospirillum fermentarium]
MARTTATVPGDASGRRLLITRPAEDAAPLAARLAAAGFITLVEPMLEMVWLDGPEPEVEDVQALLFTSANGVRAFTRRTGRRDRPVLAVGDATARAARDAGFVRVESAAGDVHALAGLVRERCTPTGGVLLHVAGTTVAGDLAGMLAQHGFAVRRLSLYDARPSRRLTPATIAALTGDSSDDRLDGVLIFSPRTARSFVSLVAEAGHISRCRTVDVYCLSPAVAEAVCTCPSGPVSWRRVQVAARPDQDALLALLGAP